MTGGEEVGDDGNETETVCVVGTVAGVTSFNLSERLELPVTVKVPVVAGLPSALVARLKVTG